MSKEAVDAALAVQDARSRRCEAAPDAVLPLQTTTKSRSCGYATVLAALQEGPLWAEAGEAYRFLWVRTFHAPIVVRVERAPDGHSKLVAKVLDGSGGYVPGCIVDERRRDLTPAEADELQRRYEAVFSVPLQRPTPPGAPISVGFDGAQWVFERSARRPAPCAISGRRSTRNSSHTARCASTWSSSPA